MKYKILEANGIEIENIDGGAFNNFSAGGKSGIISGILNECKITTMSNVLTLDKGELLVKGVRIKITEPVDFSLTGVPAIQTNYHLVARVVLSEDRSITFEIIVRPISTLQQDDLYVADKGTFELEICRFIHSTNGSIENIVVSVEKLEGASGKPSVKDFATTEDIDGLFAEEYTDILEDNY